MNFTHLEIVALLNLFSHPYKERGEGLRMEGEGKSVEEGRREECGRREKGRV